MASSATAIMHQHQQPPIRVSAMPLTPSRSTTTTTARSRQTTSSSVNSNTSSTTGSKSLPSTPSRRQQQTAPRWEDIMKEAPDARTFADHQVLPEDELEDLLSLPIAAELRPKRSKASNVASSSDALAFPPQSNALELGDSIHEAYNSMHQGSSNGEPNIIQSPPLSLSQSQSQPQSRRESLRKRSQSNPARASPSPSSGGNNVELHLHPPPPPSLLPRASNMQYGYHLEPSNSLQSPEMQRNPSYPASSSSSSACSSNKKARMGSSSSSTGKSQLASAAAARTNNAASQQPPVTPTNKVTAGSSRKQANLNGGSSSGPRKPSAGNTSSQSSNNNTNRQASTPLKRSKTSGSPRSSMTRPRASSASLLSRPSYYEWDETSKPPWLDENPTYLYKSDIEAAPQPGSLAYMALQAQGRLPADSSSSSSAAATGTCTGSGTAAGNQDPDGSFMGDTSIRSWDDVILPAVAKQIRAQQLLEAQKRAEQEDDELLVTEWNVDGTPKKWKRVGNKKKQVERYNQKDLPQEPDAALSPGGTSSSPTTMLTSSALDSASPSTSRDIDKMYQNPSLSSQQLSTNHHRQQTSSVDSHTNSTRPSHYTGRREVWEDPALKSPNTARTNGFQSAQMQGQSFGAAMTSQHQHQQECISGGAAKELTAGQMYDAQRSRKEGSGKTTKEDGSHGSGCCKCTIM